jgi:hypothetical protein
MATAQKTQLIVLTTVPSKSNPDKHYEIRLGGDNRVYCTCPAWRFSKGQKTCKHLNEFRTANPSVAAKTI